MILALVGNQNCGKTTLFNQLTGSNQHVGNFPGITVEQKIGVIRNRKNCSVVDLPGIYSLRTYSAEEMLTRDFILNEKPDGIINIVDATNIERNLYLTLQLIELNIPMVLALNMMDEVRSNRGSIDVRMMSEKLGIPVVPVSASKNEGIVELTDHIVQVVKNRTRPSVGDFCLQGPVHRCIHSVMHIIEDHAEDADIFKRFAAVKLIEADADIARRLNVDPNELEMIEHSVLEMETEHGMDRNAAIADMRYDFIENLCAAAVTKSRESNELRRSVKIDSVLTHRYLAIPLFLVIMAAIFWLTFSVLGAFFSDLLTAGIALLAGAADAGLLAYGINPVVRSLVIDGVFGGVGSVLGFLPVIVVLFFFLSVLEDTGYMARVAFIMDKLLRKIGLSGRSFVPMLIGFGCSVPAIMATRTLSSDRDRKMTILLTPYMSCSAKIPIYALFVAAFFSSWRAAVMTGLYLTGALIGILVALIYKKTLFKGNPVPFVMELPNYRLPSPKTVLLLMWDKAKDFFVRAFTVIFVATMVIWFLVTFDAKLNVVADDSLSLLAVLGRFIAPVFTPLGFGDWRIAASLVTGLTAKEAVIGTLGVLTGSSAGGIAQALAALFTPVSAVSFLIFTLLYTPCFAAVAAMNRELGSKLKTLGVVTAQCGVAWISAFTVYRLLLLFTGRPGMGPADYLILTAVAVWLALSLVFVFRRRKKGGCAGCSGDCAGCAAAGTKQEKKPV